MEDKEALLGKEDFLDFATEVWEQLGQMEEEIAEMQDKVVNLWKLILEKVKDYETHRLE